MKGHYIHPILKKKCFLYGQVIQSFALEKTSAVKTDFGKSV